MVTKQKIRQRKIQVIFAMPAIEDCNCLYLVGTFNGWSESVYRMQGAEDGTWSLALELEPGREYQYRYRTDKGVWYTDSVSHGYARNPDGSKISIVRV